MLTVHNVVAAAATVGLVGREGELMRKVAIPCLHYLFAAGFISYLFVWGLGVNVGTIGLAVMVGLGIVAMLQGRREQRASPAPGHGARRER